MRKCTKWLLAIGLVLVLAGGAMAVTGWALGGETGMVVDWNGYGLQIGAASQRGPAQEGGARSLAPFQSIRIDVSYADVTFVESQDYGVALQWRGDMNALHYAVEDGALRVWDERSEKHLINLGVGSGACGQVTVYYPAQVALDTVAAAVDTGEIQLSGVKAKSLTAESSFGDVALTNCVVDTLEIQMDSGSFTGQGLQSQTLILKNDFGTATLSDSTAESANITMDSGDLSVTDCAFQGGRWSSDFGTIQGEGLTTGGLVVESGNGTIALAGALAGATELRADFGRVQVTSTLPRRSYSWDLGVDFGRITVDEKPQAGKESSQETGGENRLTIRSGSGDVDVRFGPG